MMKCDIVFEGITDRRNDKSSSLRWKRSSACGRCSFFNLLRPLGYLGPHMLKVEIYTPDSWIFRDNYLLPKGMFWLGPLWVLPEVPLRKVINGRRASGFSRR